MSDWFLDAKSACLWSTYLIWFKVNAPVFCPWLWDLFLQTWALFTCGCLALLYDNNAIVWVFLSAYQWFPLVQRLPLCHHIRHYVCILWLLPCWLLNPLPGLVCVLRLCTYLVPDILPPKLQLLPSTQYCCLLLNWTVFVVGLMPPLTCLPHGPVLPAKPAKLPRTLWRGLTDV